MKALILVGGYGTRLRPLTFSCPKPLVPFCNKPIVLHQIEALAAVGVKQVVLAVSYQPQAMIDSIKDWEKKLGITISISVENEPLGTAGPLALAKELLTKDKEPFFMFNSDVICEFPLKKLLEFHRGHGQEGTILVTPVEDPSKYGVVLTAANGEISQFIEKPKVPVSNRINAGMYLFETAILDRIELKPTSIEREIFPKMAAEKKLYAMDLPGYWMDIGQPADFVRGTVLHLNFLSESKQLVAPKFEGVTFKGNVLVDPTATIEAGSVIGPNVVLGPNVRVGKGVRLERAIVFERSRINSYSSVKNSILGWENVVGSWTFLNNVVSGRDVSFGDEIVCLDITVCPHKGIKENELHSKIIM